MRLETKYGVLEGTVEEFRELLEDKVDLSYFSGEADCSWIEEEDKSGYYVVNKDMTEDISGEHIPKGLVLKHLVGDRYEDTTGNKYLIDAKDLDVCNDNHIEESFKNSKSRGTLLKQGITKPEYYIVNNDNAICHIGLGKHVPRGLVLEYTSKDWYTPRNIYKDTLGNLYELNDKDLDVCNMSWVDGKFKSFKDKDLLLIQKNQF